MDYTESWYEQISDTLASVLTELRDRGIGGIPLQNLIEVPKNADKKELSSLINDDGVPAMYWQFTSLPNDDDVIVVVK